MRNAVFALNILLLLTLNDSPWYNKVNEHRRKRERGRENVESSLFFFSLQCSTLIFANGFNGAKTWHTFHLKVINPVTINYHRGKCNVANIMCCTMYTSNVYFKWLNISQSTQSTASVLLLRKEDINKWMNEWMRLWAFLCGNPTNIWVKESCRREKNEKKYYLYLTSFSWLLCQSKRMWIIK